MEVHKVAELARIQLTVEQEKEFSDQLESVLVHFAEISKVDTSGVEPMVTPTVIKNFIREDVAEKWQYIDDALAAAPAKIGNLFKVPPVV